VVPPSCCCWLCRRRIDRRSCRR